MEKYCDGTCRTNLMKQTHFHSNSKLGSQPEECDCKEKSCPSDCARKHTHKGFFCPKCQPEEVKHEEGCPVGNDPTSMGGAFTCVCRPTTGESEGEVKQCTSSAIHDNWCDCGRETCWEEELRLKVNFDKNSDREVCILFIHRLLSARDAHWQRKVEEARREGALDPRSKTVMRAQAKAKQELIDQVREWNKKNCRLWPGVRVHQISIEEQETFLSSLLPSNEQVNEEKV